MNDWQVTRAIRGRGSECVWGAGAAACELGLLGGEAAREGGESGGGCGAGRVHSAGSEGIEDEKGNGAAGVAFEDDVLCGESCGSVGTSCKEHELRAAKEREMRRPPPAGEWEWLIDQCVGMLHRKDQRAVLSRFYEEKTLAEVGMEMGVSEEAARKRINRAMESLRG